MEIYNVYVASALYFAYKAMPMDSPRIHMIQDLNSLQFSDPNEISAFALLLGLRISKKGYETERGFWGIWCQGKLVGTVETNRYREGTYEPLYQTESFDNIDDFLAAIYGDNWKEKKGSRGNP